MLALSATKLSWGGRQCSTATASGDTCPPTTLEVAFFYMSLYLVAIARGGHKPCIQAFGADQFDPADESSISGRSSFFNWWTFGLSTGTAITTILLSYVQDNIGWGLGFGISSIVMACFLAIFLFGTRTYRNVVSGCSKKAFAFGGGASKVSSASQTRHKDSPRHRAEPQQLEFSVGLNDDMDDKVGRNAVDEAKDVLRLFPIWVTFLTYAVAFAQTTTFFMKQAATLDRRIGHVIVVPPAALWSIICITQMVLIPIYDGAIVPLARRFTGVPSGFTMLQRMAVGLVLCLVCMVTAALVEGERLRVAAAGTGRPAGARCR
ncbi:hypothetical protein ACP4OV_010896 [Aristida adscensionis]